MTERNGISNESRGVAWMGVGVTLLTAVFAIGIMVGVRKKKQQDRLVNQDNVQAQATILKMWDTGITFNHDPQIGLLLEIQPPDERPYQIETKQIVHRTHLAELKTGTVIPVQLHPDDYTRFTIMADAEK